MSIRYRYDERFKPGLWTPEEALHHLTGTFNLNVKQFPDIMEPYVVMLADAPESEHMEIMRSALRNTIKQRYPL